MARTGSADPSAAIDAAEQLTPGFAAPEDLVPAVRMARLYFGNDLFGTTLGGIQPWGTGEEPVLMVPRASADPDMKRTVPVPATAVPGVTVAGKGEVTGEDKRPKRTSSDGPAK